MATFKGFAMKKLNETGWVEKEVPECGPLDAIIKRLHEWIQRRPDGKRIEHGSQTFGRKAGC